jgi:hypothetical protein
MVALAAFSLSAADADEGVDAGQDFAFTAIRGSLRSGYWVKDRKLDDQMHFGTLTLWTRAALQLTSKVSVVVDGWVGFQNLGRDETAAGALREAYLSLSLGKIDFRFGKQIVVWGRADALNPTDNISPRDLTLLTPYDDDQRSGAYALKGTYYLKSLSLTGMWLPGFQAHVVPLPAQPPPLVFQSSRPSAVDTLGQGALKLEQTGKAVDWSLSYFDGYDRSPDLGLGPVSLTEVEVLLRHHRIRVLGGDFAATVGRFGIRGEAAFTFTENWRGHDPQTKSPFFLIVVGGDRTFLEYLNVNVQYTLRVVVNYHSPFDIPDPIARGLAIEQAAISNQLDRVQHGGTFRISNKWLNETLEAEATGAFFLPRFNYALRAKIAYALSDRWKGIIGGEYFNGEQPSFFALLNENWTAFAELRLSF